MDKGSLKVAFVLQLTARALPLLVHTEQLSIGHCSTGMTALNKNTRNGGTFAIQIVMKFGDSKEPDV